MLTIPQFPRELIQTQVQDLLQRSAAMKVIDRHGGQQEA